MLTGKKLDDNKDLIAETVTYFEANVEDTDTTKITSKSWKIGIRGISPLIGNIIW